MIGVIFPVASVGIVHTGIVGMACIACRFLQWRANAASEPRATKKQAKGMKLSQSCGLSNHQNNSHVPTLNQMAVRIKLPSSRWPSALSHASIVKHPATQ